MKFYKKLFIGASALSVSSYLGSYYFFPEVRKNHYQLYKAFERATRIVITGAKMVYVYKKVYFSK